MKKILIFLFALVSLVDATDFYKPFIPIFPQVSNGRYFKATILTGVSIYMISDIVKFDDIYEDRKITASKYEKIWQQNMFEQTGNSNFYVESFVADSSFLDYSKTNRTLYTSYLNAVTQNRRVLEAEYQKNTDKMWLVAGYTYSFFDALEIYYPNKKQNINSFDAMIRSIIIPGWGQIYTGSYSHAGFIYSMLIGLGGHAFYSNKLTNYYEYSILPEHQKQAEKYSTSTTSYLLYMLGVYLYNIVDAYVEGELSNFNLDISGTSYIQDGKNINANFSINYLF